MTTAARPPAVSVIIPCYNYGRYLRTAVASVVGQRDVRTKILIIDDASTDDSPDVASALSASHPDVEWVAHRHNRGHIRTYNEGLLEWAAEEYSVLLSADDCLTPGALSRAVRLMSERPSVGFVYGRTREFSDDCRLPPVRMSRHQVARVWSGTQWLSKRCREGVNVVPTPSVVVRTAVQQRAGGYRAELPHAGDFEMWLRLAALADVGYIGGIDQAYYRVHRRSMSQRVYQEKLADVRERRQVFLTFFEQHSDSPAVAGVDPGATMGRLASQPLWWACRAYEKGTVASSPVDQWVAFAKETYPDVRSLPAFRALERRRRLGEALCHRTQIFAGTAVARRATNILWWERWKRFGG